MLRNISVAILLCVQMFCLHDFASAQETINDCQDSVILRNLAKQFPWNKDSKDGLEREQLSADLACRRDDEKGRYILTVTYLSVRKRILYNPFFRQLIAPSCVFIIYDANESPVGQFGYQTFGSERGTSYWDWVELPGSCNFVSKIGMVVDGRNGSEIHVDLPKGKYYVQVIFLTRAVFPPPMVKDNENGKKALEEWTKRFESASKELARSNWVEIEVE